ncbi:hypothetical protein [Streptomyces sp. NPDC091268]|uniref:hypothetical protein n=1 Tax=Streptomyces sp. NPDC091268 TaxID=3365979 RepID=UPI0037F57998
MSTKRSRRIDRHTAEQLLSGAGAGTAPGAAPGHAALEALLAAAAASAHAYVTTSDPSREDEAVAVFRAARLTVATAPASPRTVRRRGARAATGPGRSPRTPAALLGAKIAAASLAATLGGVALAAGTGHLPAAVDGGPGSAGPGPAPAATPEGPVGERGAAPLRTPARSSAAVPPELAELCRGFARDGAPRPSDAPHGAPSGAPSERFAPLVEAAGGPAAVADYCAPVLEAPGEASGAPPTGPAPDDPRPGGPTRPAAPDAGGRPDGPGTARTPGPETDHHPTDPAKSDPPPRRGTPPTGRPDPATP